MLSLKYMAIEWIHGAMMNDFEMIGHVVLGGTQGGGIDVCHYKCWPRFFEQKLWPGSFWQLGSKG